MAAAPDSRESSHDSQSHAGDVALQQSVELGRKDLKAPRPLELQPLSAAAQTPSERAGDLHHHIDWKPMRSLLFNTGSGGLSSVPDMCPEAQKDLGLVSSSTTSSDSSRPPSPPSPAFSRRATPRKREGGSSPSGRAGPVLPTKKLYKRCGEAGFRGVTRRSHKWRAQLWHQGKLIVIGSTFSTPEDAARAFDEKSFELLGVNALFNFPEEYSHQVKLLMESSTDPTASPHADPVTVPKKRARRKQSRAKQDGGTKKARTVKKEKSAMPFVIAPDSPPNQISFSEKDMRAAQIILTLRV